MTLRKVIFAYAGLLLLLALTIGSSFVDLSGLNAFANLAIAAAKTVIIVMIFMNFMEHGPLPRLAAGAGLLWLMILFALTLIDQPQG
jgi:cytochrome c oxidase subunit 4